MMITDSIISKQQEILHIFSDAEEARKKQKLHTETKKQKALQDEEKIMLTRAELYQFIVNIKHNFDQLIDQTKETDIGCSVVFAEENARQVVNQLDILEQYLSSRDTLKLEDISFLKENISKTQELLKITSDIVRKKIQDYKDQINRLNKEIANLNKQKSGTQLFLKNLPTLILASGFIMYIINKSKLIENTQWLNKLAIVICFTGCFITILLLIEFFRNKK